MKKLKYLVIAFALFLMIPFGVFAKDKVNVYLFRGDGCPHCEEAEEFFNSIESEYGKYYDLIGYEVWYNENNAKLMEAVAEKLGTTAEGVPFIVIGDKYYSGFASNMGEEIKTAIKDAYDSGKISVALDNVSDDLTNAATPEKINNVNQSGKSNDAVALIIILAVVCLLVLLFIYARNKTNKVNQVVEEVKDVTEEKVEEAKETVKESVKEVTNTTTKKKSNTKKKTNTKKGSSKSNRK